MPKKPEDAVPQPAPENDSLTSGGGPTAPELGSQDAVCPIWGEACRPVIDPVTGQAIGRMCMLRKQVENQPPEHGVVDPVSVNRMVTKLVQLGKGDGYEGPCPELQALEQLAEAKLAQYPLDMKRDES